MTDMPEYIYSVAAVREMDRIAIEDHGVSGYTLMQRAAEAALCDTLDCFPESARCQVVCGAGNNGGDGYVFARLAQQRGLEVTAVSLVKPDGLSGDARQAYDDYVAAGGQVSAWTGSLDGDADLLVDALLGSGIDRAVSGTFAEAIDAMNGHWAPVVALDIPSGLDGNTGEILGVAVVADLTSTFVGLKTGLLVGDGPELSGEIRLAELQIPRDWVADVQPAYRVVNDQLLADCLPPRPNNAHKGDFGHVLVIGGGQGMPGAALLCGSAALRAGAGRVSLATHASHSAALAAARPELMVHGIDQAGDLLEIFDVCDVIVVGPGLGRDAWAESLLDVVAGDERPAVWDADALNLLADRPDLAKPRVITPHPGEAARLLGVSATEIQEDRDVALQKLARRGQTVVLKGSGTLTGSGDEPPYFCLSGNPGMAAAGMGDALTGIVAAMLAQGLADELAAAIAVEVHARAGDIAAEQGERGLLASDLIDALPWVVNP